MVVVQAIPKGERGELAVEMLTEVGVDVIVPWAARGRSRWKGERAEQVAGQVALGRAGGGEAGPPVLVPEVSELATTDDVVALLAKASVRVVLHEAASGPLADVPVPGRGEIVIVVGPEGGIPTRSWRRSPRSARSRCGWARRCCAPRPPGWPPRRRCWPAPPAGADEPRRRGGRPPLLRRELSAAASAAPRAFSAENSLAPGSAARESSLGR